MGYTTRDNGVAISTNAEYAEISGKFPQHLFIKMYPMSKKAFEFLCNHRIIITREWHHTGKNFKQTDYFEWADDFDYSNAQCEEGSYGYIYAQNKKMIDKILKELLPYKHITFFEKAEGKFAQPSFVDYCWYHWKEFLTEKELGKYDEVQYGISTSKELEWDRIKRKELHQSIESQWREKTIESKMPSMKKEYEERYVIPNQGIEEKNKDIYIKNQNRYDNYLKEISTDATSGEFQVFSILSLFFNTYDSARYTHDAVYEFEKQKITNEISRKTEEILLEREKERTKNTKKFQNWVNKNIENGNLEKISRCSYERISNFGELFIEEYREQYGKYGWFASRGYSYNLPEYYTGLVCKSKAIKRKYRELEEKTEKVPSYKIQEDLSKEAYNEVDKYRYFPAVGDLKTNLSISTKNSFGILMF